MQQITAFSFWVNDFNDINTFYLTENMGQTTSNVLDRDLLKLTKKFT